MPARLNTVLAGLAIDLVLGEPPARLHPVVWLGNATTVLQRYAPRGKCAGFLFGAAHVSLLLGVAAFGASCAERLARCLPWPLDRIAEASLLKTMLSLRALTCAARRVERNLAADDLDAARRGVRALVSRPADTLDRALVTSAVVESLAENASDSLVAPLLYYAIGGLPAAATYRAANTLDAMIGYHGELEYTGRAAAKVDDVLNLVPSRATAGLIVLAAALSGGDVVGAWRVATRDGGRTESPNAGWPMSAMAGALGIRLEKPGHYRLGDPLPRPDGAAIDHAIQIVRVASACALPLIAAMTYCRGRRRDERPRERAPIVPAHR
jgi:adenosylcobinamide-phosphate synthase